MDKKMIHEIKDKIEMLVSFQNMQPINPFYEIYVSRKYVGLS